MKKLNIVICIVGLLGMLMIAVIAIAESQTGSVASLVSSIPAAILFSSLFLAGYLAIQKNDK